MKILKEKNRKRESERSKNERKKKNLKVCKNEIIFIKKV